MDKRSEQIVSAWGICQALQAATPEVSLMPLSQDPQHWQHSYIKLHKQGLSYTYHHWWTFKMAYGSEYTTDNSRSSMWNFGITVCLLGVAKRSHQWQWVFSPFKSPAFTEFPHNNGIYPHSYTVYQPASNGAAECMVCNLQSTFLKYVVDENMSQYCLQQKVDAFLKEQQNTAYMLNWPLLNCSWGRSLTVPSL